MEPQDGEEEAKGNPIEITYRFPKEENSVISKMKITVGDKVIEAKVTDKEEAEEKYDDAMASGNSAFMIKDCKLFSEKFNIKFKFNSYFPIQSLNLMRGVLIARKENKINIYIYY